LASIGDREFCAPARSGSASCFTIILTIRVRTSNSPELPADLFLRVAPHLSILSFPNGRTLMDDGGVFEDVYFPLSGMISLVVEMKDGKGIEAATVGREGVVGAIPALGLPRSYVRATVQLPLICARISAPALTLLADDSRPIRDLCNRYNETLLCPSKNNSRLQRAS
jgi:CRP-like cAMP-binding protein